MPLASNISSDLSGPRGSASRVGNMGSALHSAALPWATAVMRDRRNVADRGDDESGRLQCAQSRLAARSRTLHLDFKRLHAVLHGLAPGRFRGNLRGVRRRLARALEALAAR